MAQRSGRARVPHAAAWRRRHCGCTLRPGARSGARVSGCGNEERTFRQTPYRLADDNERGILAARRRGDSASGRAARQANPDALRAIEPGCGRHPSDRLAGVGAATYRLRVDDHQAEPELRGKRAGDRDARRLCVILDAADDAGTTQRRRRSSRRSEHTTGIRGARYNLRPTGATASAASSEAAASGSSSRHRSSRAASSPARTAAAKSVARWAMASRIVRYVSREHGVAFDASCGVWFAPVRLAVPRGVLSVGWHDDHGAGR
jgi:hypothetical protein